MVTPVPQIESSPGGHVHMGIRDGIVRPYLQSTGLDVSAMGVRVDASQGKGAVALFVQISEVAIDNPAESRVIAVAAGIEVAGTQMHTARPS